MPAPDNIFFPYTVYPTPYTLNLTPYTTFLTAPNVRIYAKTAQTAIIGIPKEIPIWAATMALKTEAHPFTDQAYAR